MPLKIYGEAIALQSQKPRQIFNITTQVKAALEKSGFRDGLILVSSLHANSAVIVNDDEPGLLQDLDKWLNDIAPEREDYAHHGHFNGNAAAQFKSLLLSHQVLVPFTEARLDLGPGQFVQFVELDGLRPRRILVKVIGE